MPLTRIKNTAIGDDGVTTQKLDDTAGGLTLPGVQYVRVPVGTDAQRPTGASGYLRFNTDAGVLEQWNTNTNSWAAVDSPPIITQVSYSGSATATEPAGGETITLTGSNFQSGATVTIGGTSASSVTVVSTTSITFTAPAKTAGDYDVVVTNPNGLTATSTNGISYNGTPSFTTAAGNVGSVNGGETMATITIVAAEPDGGTLAYSITSGALPTGVSMSSAGAITGTPDAPTSSTTFNFTVTATDDENQTNSRAFNLIVVRPIYSTQISNSIRFDDTRTTSLSLTPSSGGNRKKWTLSMWIKQVRTNTNEAWFSAYENGDNYFWIGINSSNQIQLQQRIANANAWVQTVPADEFFRDTTGWSHLVYAVDTTQATNTDRAKLYLNGRQITITQYTSNTIWPGQNDDFTVNHTVAHYIGRDVPNNYYVRGYVSDFHFVDNAQLTPTSFGEEHNGVWTPKTYSGSHGTAGAASRLTFSDSSNLGDDTSGNGFDWTHTNGLSSDSVPDSPTNNWCVLNWINSYQGLANQHTDGGLTHRAGSNAYKSYSSQVMTNIENSQLYYAEVSHNGTGGYGIGIIPAEGTTGAYNNTSRTGFRGIYSGGNKYEDTTSTSYFSGFNADGQVMGILVGNGEIKFFQDGVDQGVAFSGLSGDYNFVSWGAGVANGGAGVTWNFGQDPTFSDATTFTSPANATDANGIGKFYHTVPTGAIALCARNVPEDSLDVVSDERGEDYQKQVLYTGNGWPTSNTQTISTIGFRPDLVWIKNRAQSNYNHYLIDSVRGPTKVLRVNTTNGEGTESGSITAFTDTGFTLGNNNEVNNENDSHIAWCWKAGGAPTATNSAGVGAVPTAGSVKVDGSDYTSNLAGTLAATKITANTKAGFSIIQWTGNQTNNTLAHCLNSAPEMVIVKNTVYGSASWYTWTPDIANNEVLALNSNVPDFGSTPAFIESDMTATTIGVGTERVTNGTNEMMMAYVWHSVQGYSKIGYYTGNGQADGPVIYTGFKPQFIMFKNKDATEGWYIFDNAQDSVPKNPRTTYLNPSSPGIGSTGTGTNRYPDFLTNGFKITASDASLNGTGNRMIYMAFAEHPFKYTESD